MDRLRPRRTTSAVHNVVNAAGKKPTQKTKSYTTPLVTEQDITALGFPEDLRALMHIDAQQEYIYIFYADLEQYCATHPTIVDPNAATYSNSRRSATPEAPSIVVDMTSYTPARPPNESFNVLPYITLALGYQDIRFNVKTGHIGQHALLCSFASIVLSRHVWSWRKMVVNSAYVAETRLRWKEKCVEIILKANTEWVVEWEYGTHRDEYGDSVELKADLGLEGLDAKGWGCMIIVESVEEKNM